jgi:hypothetical protein
MINDIAPDLKTAFQPEQQAGQTGRTDILFIENNIVNYQALAASAAPGAEVHILDASKDGLQQIAQILGGRQDIDALHIVSHGAEAALDLGALTLTAATVVSHAADLHDIGQALAPGGDILLYGCDTAMGSDGAAFVSAIAAATGADVAASTDLSGSANAGGNWVLEHSTGPIEAATMAFSAFQGALVSVAGTIAITTSQSNFDDYGPVFNDGEGGSNNIAGIVYDFSFTDASGNPYGTVEAFTNVFNNPIAGLLDSNADAGVAKAVFKTDNQQNFKLGSFFIQDTNGLDGTWTVTGYDNGVAVNGASYSFTIAQTGDYDATVTLPSAFQNIDEVRIAVTGGVSGNAIYGTTFNNFVVTDPVVDTTPPTATVVVANNALNAGASSLVTFTFSEAVTGFTNADLTIPSGTLSTLATSDHITFTATLTPTANLTDATNVIAINMAGLQDAAGNAGIGTVNSNNYAVDTQRPTATIALDHSALAAGGSAVVTFTFSEAVSGFTNSDLTVPNGTLSAVASSDGGIIWTATYTPNANVTAASNVITLASGGVADAAGNTNSSATSSGNFTIDTARPTASVVVADNALKIGDTSLVTFTFSEAVHNFTNAGLTVANGTLSTVSSSDGGVTWTATLTPTAGVTDATNVIALNLGGVLDAANNTGSGSVDSNNYAIDGVRPTASAVVADTALGVGATSLVTFTFSEAVSFSNADITVGNGTLSAVASSDGGITWTATLTPTAGVTAASNTIAIDMTAVTDLAGNAGSGSVASNHYAIDSTAPTATIALAHTALLAGETSLVTITFSEAVTGLTVADLTAPNGTLGAVASSDGGLTWTATYTPNAGVSDASNVITLASAGVADLAGNANSGTVDSANFTIDTVRPTAVIIVADAALNAAATSLVTITFSEAVTGFTNADLTVANGALSAVSSSDGGITWTATLTPDAHVSDASNLITLDNGGVANAAGNTGSGITDSNNYAIDSAAPTSNIVLATPTLGTGQTSLVTFTFSEAVTGFSNADLTVAGGTLTAVSSSDGGVTWTATFTATAATDSSSVVVTLDNSLVADLAGNAGSGSTHNTTTPVTPPPSPPDTGTGTGTTSTVDGVTVQTSVSHDAATGLTIETLTVPITTTARADDPTSAHPGLADIPLGLSSGSGSTAVTAGLTVSLPVGTGLETEGPTTLLSNAQALIDLINRIHSKTATSSAVQVDMSGEGSDFLGALSAGTVLETKTIVLTVAPGTDLASPILITGSSTTPAAGAPANASAIGLVIDATHLPAGAVLQLDNVDFAAVVGAATLRGGAGENYVVGDDAAQNILLGADDDILHGGGGNDIIGSAGGNDQLYGDDGNDIVYGGIGNDTLHGGNGNDMLQGGRTDEGQWNFYLNGAGQVVGYHNTVLADASATEQIMGSELNMQVGLLSFAGASAATLQSLSLLYHAAFGRAPDLAGLDFWAATSSHASLAQIASGFITAPEWQNGNAKLGDAAFVDQLYENAIGHAGSAAETATALAQLSGAADNGAARAQLLLSVSQSADSLAAAQTGGAGKGLALGGDLLTQEQGWIAGSGDDVLDGGAGTNVLVGGDGIDTAVYTGARGDYKFLLTSGGDVEIASNTALGAGGSIDTIRQIEKAQFSDGTIDIGFTQAAPSLLQELGLLYQSVLGRPADLPGLVSWIANGSDGAALAAGFVDSVEFQAHYGTLSNTAFVETIETNALQHTPDAATVATWTTYLDTHSRAEMVVALIGTPAVQAAQFGSAGLWLA